MPKNIDAFNAVTLDILGMLYELHPSKGDFRDADLSETSRRLVSEVSADPRVQNRFWWDAGNWLEKEGYIRIGFKPLSGDTLGFMDLTSKGFAALSAVPSSLTGKEPVGDRIAETMAKAAGEARSAAIGELVGAIFGGVIRSLGQ